MFSMLLLILGCEQEGAEPPIADRSPSELTHHEPQGAEGHATPDPNHQPEVRTAGERPEAADPPTQPAQVTAALLSPPAQHDPAPDTYQIEMETTQGSFSVTCHRSWSPNGADRLYWLVQNGFYQDIAFFRVINGFMAQFGIHGTTDVSAVYSDNTHAIKDDPAGVQSNTRGRLTFATAGPDTRTTQLFINFRDNSNLDAMGFSPVCEVDGDGMSVVDKLHKGYGEGAPRGAGPRQDFINSRGNEYLRGNFPRLDYLQNATIKP